MARPAKPLRLSVAPIPDLSEAEALRQQWLRRAEMAAVVDWLERRHQLGRDVFARGRPDLGRWGRPADDAGLRDDAETDDPAAAANGAEDVPPVAGGDLTDLLRACLVALRLPPHAEAFQPRRLPFWGIGDATARITWLLRKRPEGGELEAVLPKIGPKIGEAGAARALHCRAAVAATFVAGLELARDGALTLQQDAPWQPVQVHRHNDNLPDSAAEPTTE